MSPISQALTSLHALSIGDAFGQCFFQIADPDHAIAMRQLPIAPWYYTDDTQMSLSLLACLNRFGKIEQDYLATSFARHYDYDRAYGPSMHRVLARIGAGEDWRDVARTTFEGQGSWGNGAAMRSAPLGAYFAQDSQLLIEQATLSAEITHAHPEGIAGAIAVALAAASAVRAKLSGTRLSHGNFLTSVIDLLPASEVRSRLMRALAITKSSSLPFAISVLGNGTQMSAQDTVPFALWCCAQHLDDFAEALWLAVSAGGDRDTICAIVGGVLGCHVGTDGIPAGWQECREPLPDWHLNDA